MTRFEKNLMNAYNSRMNSASGMSIQPDLNENEKASIYMNLGGCEILAAILTDEFGINMREKYGASYKEITERIKEDK